MIQETVKEVKNGLFKRGYVNVQDTNIKTDKKSEIRYKIEQEVFDLEDSVADNAKMISLIISVLYRVYDIIPEEQKKLMTDEDKSIIEAVFSNFKNISTRADVQFKQEGVEMVSRILDRQHKIGTIIS